MTITKDMTIGQILEIDINTARILMDCGMHCIGCPSSQGESLEEACMVHGIDCEEVTASLNEFLADRDRFEADMK